MTLKKSPIHEVHVELKASFEEFAGWYMPITYTSGIKEHLAVREKAGVFDVSHMGRIKVTGGEDALVFLQKLVPKDLSKISPGSMSGPTAFLNEHAGFKDDVMLYNNDKEWYIVCNAVNREKILDWLRNWETKWGANVGIEDITFDIVMLALQGPYSVELMRKLGLEKALELKMMQFYRNLESIHGKVFLVSRSGWTGEDGFEIWASPEVGAKIFKALVENGATPAGLAARDTLRLEMGFVLYGHDIDENTTPVEARYWVWTPGKTGYIGYEALKEVLKRGVDRIRVGVKMKKKVKAIPREGDLITIEGEVVGKVTSGNYSPTLKRGIGMAYVDSRHALIGLEIEANIRGRVYPGKLVDFPLVKK